MKTGITLGAAALAASRRSPRNMDARAHRAPLAGRSGRSFLARRLFAAGLIAAGVLISVGAPASPEIRTQLADALVRPGESRFASHRWAKEPEVVALYFGAGWCAPCHAFVPKLKAVYEELRRVGADTEVVFVSLDRSERAMLRYMQQQQMPWPAVDYRRLASLPAVRLLAGKGPPNLVLIDRQGRILASAWQDGAYLGTAKVLRLWVERVGKKPLPDETPATVKPAPPE